MSGRSVRPCIDIHWRAKLPSSDDRIKGARVLLVEDSPVVSDATADMLSDLGCEVVGPAGTMAPALTLASEEQLDAAIVDINIRGGKAFSVLSLLRQRGVPFLLTSGYADWTLPEEWQDCPRLPKPYSEGGLRDAIERLLGEKAAAS